MGVVLQSSTTSAMTRITVHGQYNHKAFGFFLLNNLIPIVLNVRRPGPHYERVVLMFGPRLQAHTPYEDLGMVERECRKVFAFNIRHYVKCYLPSTAGSDGQPTMPFTYNLCQACGASVVDGRGQLLQRILKRSYRADKYVWRANNSLQNTAGSQPVFNHHEGIL